MDNPPAAPLISIIMMNRPPLSNRKLLFTGAALFALLNTLPALEPRLWISLDGRTIDAELIKTDGDIVELKDKEGRVLKVPKSSLSFGDLDYIAEYGPEEKKSSLGSKPAGKAKVPNPAKEMKFSPKSVKKDAGEIKLGTLSFQVTETPRFKILTSKGVDPMDTAELAERLWHDMAFFHASFAGKFKDRRMAIILAEPEKDFTELGAWYVEILNAAGNTEPAADLKSRWPNSSSSAINLPADLAGQNGLLTEATVIRSAGRGAKPSPLVDSAKGVWAPFRTHTLAGHFLALQAGGTSSFAKEGIFAIFTGHAFHKEIDLTGQTVTGILHQETGKKTSAAGGYDNGKNWPGELKRRIRKEELKPSLITLFASSSNDAQPDDLAMAYSFSRFLQSTPERHTAYSKLMERISTSRQVPDLDSIAKIYSLDDGPALEKAWLAWVDSNDFR